MEKGEAQVFVDDYVLGRLPHVCAVTGVPSDDQVRFRTNVSPLSPLWALLVFLGPIGWAVLLFLGLAHRNYLAGWLPYSHEIALHRRERRRGAIIATVVAVAGFLLAASIGSGALFLVLAGISALVGLVVLFAFDREEPRIELDASGRWITLHNVHPAFSTAVAARYAGDHHSRRQPA